VELAVSMMASADVARGGGVMTFADLAKTKDPKTNGQTRRQSNRFTDRLHRYRNITHRVSVWVRSDLCGANGTAGRETGRGASISTSNG
jgi:hypothetical protein